MRKKKILIVEDNKDTAGVLQEYLTDAGFTCNVAVTGRKTLSLFGKDTFHLLIIDYKLPDMSGLEVVERCWEINASFKALFLTAFNLGNNRNLPANMHYEILQKPCKPTKILQTIKRML